MSVFSGDEEFMHRLYKLVFYDMTSSIQNGEYQERFFIGVFSAYSKANQTAKYYQRNVKGFRDYPCDYQITRKNVIGSEQDIRQVYVIQGWNVNDEFDEVDVTESDYFTDKQAAEQELLKMKQNNIRSEWVLEQLTVDECLWTEGFVRC